MSTLATAAVQHALDVAQIYKDNCTIKNGLPQAQPRLKIADDPKVAEGPPGPEGPPGKDAAVDAALLAAQIANRLKVPAVDIADLASEVAKRLPAGTATGTSWWKPAVLTAATLIGGGTAGYLIAPSPTSPQLVQPSDQGTDLLLPYLEQQGYHLPKDKRPISE